MQETLTFSNFFLFFLFFLFNFFSCDGGSNYFMAILPMIATSLLLFLAVLVLFLCGTSKKSANLTSKMKQIKRKRKIFGQVKILLSFFQVFSSMPDVLSIVPWPKVVLEFTIPLSIFNLDFLTAFSQSSCTMSVRFFDKFILHMALPVLSLLAIWVAFLVAKKCVKKSNEKRQTYIKETVSKIAILIVLLLFPGLSTKIFQVFKCQSVNGFEQGDLLSQDFAVICHTGEHLVYVFIALGFLCLYILGIPITMLLLLWRNKNDLFQEDSPRHHFVKTSLGGLYTQYEPQYWWFELVLLLNKTLMCGGLVVLSPGSSYQVLFAILIMFFHLLAVLKLAPYHKDSEDWSSTTCTMTLMLTPLGAYAMMLRGNPNDIRLIGTVLVVLTAICVTTCVLIMLIADCGMWERICNRWTKPKESDFSLTKVQPIDETQQEIKQDEQDNQDNQDGYDKQDNQDNQDRRQNHYQKQPTDENIDGKKIEKISFKNNQAVNLKSIRQQYGAGSLEYINAVNGKKVQQPIPSVPPPPPPLLSRTTETRPELGATETFSFKSKKAMNLKQIRETCGPGSEEYVAYINNSKAIAVAGKAKQLEISKANKANTTSSPSSAATKIPGVGPTYSLVILMFSTFIVTTSSTVCSKGKYLVDGIDDDNVHEKNTCQVCDAGQFSSTIDSNTACEVCKMGTYILDDGVNVNEHDDASDCQACPTPAESNGIGYGFTSRRSSCEVCPEAKYLQEVITDTSKYSICFDCPGGTYLDETGKTSLRHCKDCVSIGTYSNDGSISCTICPAGWYSERSSSPSCIACKTGRFNNDYGNVTSRHDDASDCDKCPPGTLSRTGDPVCFNCPIGWSVYNSTEQNRVQCMVSFTGKNNIFNEYNY